MRLIFLWVFLFTSVNIFSKNKNVKLIFDNKCVQCHNPKGVAPFSLDNYQSCSKRFEMIKYVIENNIMPPWLADTTFSRFQNERVLTKSERNAILKWTKKNCPKKNYIENPISLQPIHIEVNKNNFDTIICLQKKYMVDNFREEMSDNYVFPFVSPKNKYIKDIKFLFFDESIIHHSILNIFKNTNKNNNKIEPMNNKIMDENNPIDIMGEKDRIYLENYVPGCNEFNYLNGFGVELPYNYSFLINNHYPILKNKSYDSTCLGINFYPNKPTKLIKTLLLEFAKNDNSITLSLPKNKVTTFKKEIYLDKDINTISIFPHMNQIGKSINVEAILPSQKIIPLIRINKWDFYRQEEYKFKETLFLPKGTMIRVVAVYDNTSSNPNNFNIPPKDIFFGGKTTDEMLQIIFKYW
jgi:hypothetical protein